MHILKSHFKKMILLLIQEKQKIKDMVSINQKSFFFNTRKIKDKRHVIYQPKIIKKKMIFACEIDC